MKGSIVVKLGNINFEAPRQEVMEVVETPDGLNFHFLGGSFFSYVNQYLSSELKQKIKLTVDRYPTSRVIIDLNNLKQPVLVEINDHLT